MAPVNKFAEQLVGRIYPSPFECETCGEVIEHGDKVYCYIREKDGDFLLKKPVCEEHNPYAPIRRVVQAWVSSITEDVLVVSCARAMDTSDPENCFGELKTLTETTHMDIDVLLNRLGPEEAQHYYHCDDEVCGKCNQLEQFAFKNEIGPHTQLEELNLTTTQG